MNTESKEGAIATAPSIVKVLKSKVSYKEITVRASRAFTVLPKQVQDETRTRIGAFSLPEEMTAYRSLTDDEVKEFGANLIGAIPGEQGYAKISNEYFNSFSVLVNYDEGVTLKVPVNENGEIVLDYDRRNYVRDIMRYRHVTHHPRVAKDFAQWEEATHLYIAYIVDQNVVKQGKIGNKELRKKADRLYLELVDSKSDTRIDWILEVLRRGVKTGNLEDPPTGYIPITLLGVIDVSSISRDDKELAIEEFKMDRLDNFVEVVGDEDLEWRALLERGVIGGVFERKGNVILHEREVIGADDGEAMAKLKSPSYSETLVVIKSKMKNAFK